MEGAVRSAASGESGVWYSQFQPFDRQSNLVAHAASQFLHPLRWAS